MANPANLKPVIWKKRILVPFWVVRICLMLLIIAFYAYALHTLNSVKDVIRPDIATVVIFMLLIVFVLLLDVLAIVLFLRDALLPAKFLTMNCFQTGFWAGVLIMDIVAIGRGGSAVGIGFSVFVFLTFVGLLIYAIVNYRRAKKAAQLGHYAAAHNPAAPTANYQVPHTYNHDTAYHPPPGGQMELQNNYLPPYQGGSATAYYEQQPMKPAHMV